MNARLCTMYSVLHIDTMAADGNKLFQSEFINVIHPGSNLLGLLEYNLLNSSVALFGYYFAAFTIDRIWMGRRRMQVRPLRCHADVS